MTSHNSVFRSRDYQILAPNRTCSVQYQNVVPEKNRCKIECHMYQIPLPVFSYQILVQASWAYVIGIRTEQKNLHTNMVCCIPTFPTTSLPPVVNFWTIHTHHNDQIYRIIDWQKNIWRCKSEILKPNICLQMQMETNKQTTCAVMINDNSPVVELHMVCNQMQENLAAANWNKSDQYQCSAFYLSNWQ